MHSAIGSRKDFSNLDEDQLLAEYKECLEGKKWVSICVTNTGVEILKESQETLFKAFRKSKAPNFSFESSTGLGLAIVKELTQNLGGEVVLTSEKSKVYSSLKLYIICSLFRNFVKSFIMIVCYKNYSIIRI